MNTTETRFGSVEDLANAMRRASVAHGEHEKRTGEPARIGPTGTPRTWWRSRLAHRCLHDRGSAKFPARSDAQLREDLAEVPLDGSGAEEELGGDLRVRATLLERGARCVLPVE